MDPDGAAQEAVDDALRIAAAVVAATAGLRVPVIPPGDWRGAAASGAAEDLRRLAHRLAACHRLAEDYLHAARRAAAGV